MKTRNEKLQELRRVTENSVSLAECLKALNEAAGDLKKAIELLMDKFYKKRDSMYAVPIPENAPPLWPYILAKAYLYLKIGPDIYRKNDAFDMPLVEWDTEDLREIQSCFEQFLSGKGYKVTNPVENVSIGGFYAAMTTLHFEMQMQTAHMDEKYVIDEILFEHIMQKGTIELFNKVPLYRGFNS